MDVNKELEFLIKFKKNRDGGSGGGAGLVGGQGGCEHYVWGRG